MSRFESEQVETGIEEAFKDAMPAADGFEQQSLSGLDQPDQSGPSGLALDFLNDFFGADKRHLVAIKKRNGKNEIKAQHFDAADRAGHRAFITDNGNAGFDLYFMPNPVRGTLHKKASKNDIVEARHLWVDLDPRKTEPLETERTAMLALLTTELPDGLPRPTASLIAVGAFGDIGNSTSPRRWTAARTTRTDHSPRPSNATVGVSSKPSARTSRTAAAISTALLDCPAPSTRGPAGGQCTPRI